MEQAKQAIQIRIADRAYPMKVVPEQEELLRSAAKIINDKLKQYKDKYKSEDEQDFMAMTCLHFVTKNLEIENNYNKRPLVETLKEINLDLDEYISQIE